MKVAQASGSSAEIWYKVESTNGVTPSTDGGASTTLNAAVNPGATQIVVTSATGIAVDEILRVGSAQNQEFVKVSSIASAPTIDLDPNTKINYRHESGEAVVETVPTSNWFKLGNVRSFSPSGGRDLQRSQALSGTRVLSNFREGNYDAGADMVVEMDIMSSGLFLMHSLNTNYSTVGTTTAGASTTLSAAAAIGDATLSVTSETGFAAGEFAQVSTGSSAEVVKIGSTGVGTLTLDTTAHPNGLHRAHANGAACDEVIAPFTHTIIRGASLPPGISFLLRFSDIDSLLLVAGSKFSSTTVNVDPADLPTMNITVNSKRYQILSENIFGTPTTLENVPYAHWETSVNVGDVEQVTNQFESLSFTIENTINSTFVVGSPIKGAITPGEGSVTGSFTYQYESQQFAEATVAGTETDLDFNWTYIGDANHALNFAITKAKFEGNPHPGVASKDPTTDTKNFLARLDTALNTDVTVVMKNLQPTLEYLVQDPTP